MKWNELKNKTIGIWGKGREGTAVQAALRQFVPTAQTVLFDDADTEVLNRCETVITSPGVSLYKPEIQKARDKGVFFTTGTNLFLANKKNKTKVVGITGTKGKSTTSSILYHLLLHQNVKVVLGGNIGRPLLELLSTDADYVVAELSSYQCASLQYGCDIAVLLNLYPEHLQWHKTHENYYADKCRLAFLSKQTAANGASEEIRRRLSSLTALRYFNTGQTWHIQDSFFYNGKERFLPAGVLPLLGEHNDINACAALTVLDLLNLKDKDLICRGLKSVVPLPHRLQPVGVYQNIRFIDDSISTTPESAVAALKTFEKEPFITLIAGGFDRGQNYRTLIDYALKLKEKLHIIAMPDTGKRFFDLARQFSFDCSYESDMKNAVQKAYQVTKKGGTVLLSPAAPSYNLYLNFEERGKDFANCAKYLCGSANG